MNTLLNKIETGLNTEVKDCSPTRMGFIWFGIVLGIVLGIAAIVMVSIRNGPEAFMGKIPESSLQPVATNPYLVGANQNPKIDQPQAFEHQLLSSGCLPYVGCLWPMPNPVNIKTGLRDSEIPKGMEARTCSKAWRDCPAFANCVDGMCKPKPNIYKGF